MKTKEYKGYNGTLVLTDRAVIIKRGLKGALLGGGFVRGDKTIPYSSIIAVQLKKAGLAAGYIQLTLKGGNEAKGGLFQSTMDADSINFYNWGNKTFQEAKEVIEDRILQNDAPVASTNKYDDLEKLDDLRKKGIISDREFEEKKKEILAT